MMKGKSLARVALLALLVLLLGLKVEPQPFIDLICQGDAYQSRKEYSAASGAYRQAALLKPSSALPFLRLGQTYLAQRRYERAGEAFGQAYRLGAREQALVGLGAVYAGLGHKGRAIEYWHQALALNPKDVAVRYRLGRLYLEQGDFQAAQQEFEALLTQDEHHPMAHYQMALLMAGHDPQKATEHLLEALSEPKNPAASDAEEMLAALEEVEGERNAARAVALLGVAYLKHGELSLARRQFERAIQLHPGYAEAYAYLGYIQGQRGEYEAAWHALEKAVTLDPDSVLAHYFLGVYYRSLGMRKAARTQFWRAINLDPDNAALCVDLARTYLEEQDYTAAEGWFRAAVQREPEDARFQLVLAQFYIDHIYKVEEEGLAAALRAVKLDGTSAIAHDVLGWAYYLTRRWEEAETHLQQALALDSELARAHYHLGVLYATRGNGDAARREYQRAIDLDSEGFYRQQAEKAMSHEDK